jgi:hypothetical protein
MKSEEATPVVLGAEREIQFLGSAAIDGAPIAYVIVLSTAIAVFSFIPFSIAVAAGSSFPMSQGIYSLMGWLLGPWAGAVATGSGALVGTFLAPHTAGIPWISVSGAMTASLFASVMSPKGKPWTLWLGLCALVFFGTYMFYEQAVHRNGVRPVVFGLTYASEWFGLILFLLPTRQWIGRLIASPDLKSVALGLFLGTWSSASLMMLLETIVVYYLINWPEAVFQVLIPVIPLEMAARSLIGAVIGTGVISGLRTMALTKPRRALY